jgi:hypothetical protein
MTYRVHIQQPAQSQRMSTELYTFSSNLVSVPIAKVQQIALLSISSLNCDTLIPYTIQN